MNTSHHTSNNNIVNIFTGHPVTDTPVDRIIRLAPELDGLEMLYSNDSNPEKMYSLKILAWGLKDDGEVVGLVPWLDGISICTDIKDPLNGRWEGYYDNGIEQAFFSAPEHKVAELDSSSHYYEYDCNNPDDIVQEIPDIIGTHAVLTCDHFKTFSLMEIVSWRLLHNGDILGMIVDDKSIKTTPVLPGDSCLYPAQRTEKFKYFFQHHIANKIKSKDPEAMAALASLMDS